MSVSTRISVWVLHCLAKCLAVALPLFLSLLRAQCCSARTRRIAPKGDNWAGKGRGRCCWRPPWRARSTPSICRGRWWTSAPWPTVCTTAWYSTRAVTLNEDTAAGSVIAIRMQYCTFNLHRSRGALIVPRSAASLPIQLRLVHLIYHLTLRVGVRSARGSVPSVPPPSADPRRPAGPQGRCAHGNKPLAATGCYHCPSPQMNGQPRGRVRTSPSQRTRYGGSCRYIYSVCTVYVAPPTVVSGVGPL